MAQCWRHYSLFAQSSSVIVPGLSNLSVMSLPLPETLQCSLGLSMAVSWKGLARKVAISLRFHCSRLWRRFIICDTSVFCLTTIHTRSGPKRRHLTKLQWTYDQQPWAVHALEAGLSPGMINVTVIAATPTRIQVENGASWRTTCAKEWAGDIAHPRAPSSQACQPW